jgi:hypothetical protein
MSQIEATQIIGLEETEHELFNETIQQQPRLIFG